MAPTTPAVAPVTVPADGPAVVPDGSPGGRPLRVAVLVKAVPDPGGRLGFDVDRRLDRTGEILLSELDEYPLAVARRIAGDDGEVVALSVGPDEAEAALRRALALGADAAVQVTDDALRGSCASGTARVLAAALARLGPVDVVLTGATSPDGETSIVPVQVAARLGLPALTHAVAVDLDDGVLTTRHTDVDGTVTRAVGLPALVSVTDRADPPRYPSFAQVMAARRAPVERWDLADLGLVADDVGHRGATTAVLDVADVPPRPRGRVLVDTGDAAAELVAFLAERGLV